jgi:hypothetical protein
MQITVSITVGPDEDVGSPDEIAQKVLAALDGDPDSDLCTAYVTTPPAQGTAGTAPPPPEPPPTAPTE